MPVFNIRTRANIIITDISLQSKLSVINYANIEIHNSLYGEVKEKQVINYRCTQGSKCSSLIQTQEHIFILKHKNYNGLAIYKILQLA